MNRADNTAANQLPQEDLPADPRPAPEVGGTAKPSGWDPFEVWRKRVRDVQGGRAGRGPRQPD